MSFRNRFQLIAIAILSVIIVIVGVVRGSAESQDPASLDRRISMLEQRFYTLESSINRLQTYIASQRPQPSQPSTSDRDVILIRDEVQRLSLRLTEVECGLVKLDERTATRRSTQKSDDPCRANVDTPLHLSARP